MALIVGAAVFLALASAAVAAEGPGTLKGSLVNTTAGGGSVADQEVTLTTYKGKTETAGTRTTLSDREGKFTFSGLETAPDLAYQASVQHQGAPYFSEPVTLSADSPEKSLQMEISDATTSEEVVRASASHFVVEPDPAGVSVSEIVILKNTSDKTYVGSKEVRPGLKETLRFAVPAAAQEMEMGSGFVQSRAFPLEGGISDTWPLYPGESQRILRYRVPATGDGAAFTARITLPTDKVNVLVPDVGVQVSVSNLPNRSTLDMQGQKYLMLGGQNVAAGTDLQFNLSGLSRVQPISRGAAAPAPSGAPAMAPLIAGGVALVVVVGAAVALRRRRGRAMETEDLEEEEEEYVAAGPESEDEDLEAERDELVAAIARLDDAFEAGKIGSEEYGRLRAEKKRRLVEVAVRQRAMAGTRGDR